MPPVLSLTRQQAGTTIFVCSSHSLVLRENDWQLRFARIPVTRRAGQPAGNSRFGICAQAPDRRQLQGPPLPCDQLVVLLETAEMMVERLHLVVAQEGTGAPFGKSRKDCRTRPLHFREATEADSSFYASPTGLASSLL